MRGGTGEGGSLSLRKKNGDSPTVQQMWPNKGKGRFHRLPHAVGTGTKARWCGFPVLQRLYFALRCTAPAVWTFLGRRCTCQPVKGMLCNAIRDLGVQQ